MSGMAYGKERLDAICSKTIRKFISTSVIIWINDQSDEEEEEYEKLEIIKTFVIWVYP